MVLRLYRTAFERPVQAYLPARQTFRTIVQIGITCVYVFAHSARRYGVVARSSVVSQMIAWSRSSAHISSAAVKATQTSGRDGSPNKRQRWSSVS